MKPIYYAGPPGQCFGWGVCNANLSRELAKLTPLEMVDWQDNGHYAGIVFTPVNNSDFSPMAKCSGTKLAGYAFFEDGVCESQAANARKYDVLFVGSTWCQKQLAEFGVASTVLIQGVDTSIFRPVHVGHRKRFTIFSGGKFEFRKGQDLVLAAFRKFNRAHPETDLYCSWNNGWPEIMRNMAQSRHIKYTHEPLANGDPNIARLCTDNDIPLACVHGFPFVNQITMAGVMNQCHVGLFPNRREGGTNLVLMETMACGIPCIASAGTGHADIVDTGNAFLLRNPESVEEIVDNLEFVYDPRYGHSRQAVAVAGLKRIREFTWERMARTAIEGMEKL